MNVNVNDNVNSNATSEKLIETETDPLKKPAIICAYLMHKKKIQQHFSSS